LVALDKETPVRGFTQNQLDLMTQPSTDASRAETTAAARRATRAARRDPAGAVPNIIPEMPAIQAALSGYGVPKPQEAPAPPVPSELTRYSIPLQREDNKAYFDDLREKMKAAGLDMLGVNAAEDRKSVV